MAEEKRSLEELATEIDVASSWVSGAKARKLKGIADDLWAHAGGRKEPTVGDPELATPGPGVRAKAAKPVPAEPVVVDAVGQVGDKPEDPRPTPRPPLGGVAQT